MSQQINKQVNKKNTNIQIKEMSQQINKQTSK